MLDNLQRLLTARQEFTRQISSYQEQLDIEWSKSLYQDVFLYKEP